MRAPARRAQPRLPRSVVHFLSGAYCGSSWPVNATHVVVLETENPPPRPSKSGSSVRSNVVLILASLPPPGKVCSAHNAAEPTYASAEIKPSHGKPLRRAVTPTAFCHCACSQYHCLCVRSLCSGVPMSYTTYSIAAGSTNVRFGPYSRIGARNVR